MVAEFENDTEVRPTRGAPLPVVALVGRPNTGKSTLFNRLASGRRAVVAPLPGVTRDRNMAVGQWGGHRFLVVDTGGFDEEEGAEGLEKAVRVQALLAADEADVVIAVFDGRAGLSPVDRALVGRLRRLRKPVLFAVNKIDGPKQELLPVEFHALGIEHLHAISAEHGRNVDELMDEVVRGVGMPADPDRTEPAVQARVAIIGRPNVGKSSLLNTLLGEERSIVSEAPGTTRDPVDSIVSVRERDYLLVDTAGIRRRPRVQAHVEKASVVRAFRAIERAEVALLLVDAVEGMTEQDARVGSYAWERGRAMVVLVNKWDRVGKGERRPRDLFARIDDRFPSLLVVPKLTISALTGVGTGKIWAAIDRVVAAHRFRAATGRLNQVVERAIAAQAHPVVRGKRPRIYYATQTGISPPTFTFFVSNPQMIRASYERYLQNTIRAAFRIEGTPIRIRFRARPRRRR